MKMANSQANGNIELSCNFIQIQKELSNWWARLCFRASDESYRNQCSRFSRTGSANRAKALTNIFSSRTRATSNAKFSTELPFSKILSSCVNKMNSLRGNESADTQRNYAIQNPHTINVAAGERSNKDKNGPMCCYAIEDGFCDGRGHENWCGRNLQDLLK